MNTRSIRTNTFAFIFVTRYLQEIRFNDIELHIIIFNSHIFKLFLLKLIGKILENKYVPFYL